MSSIPELGRFPGEGKGYLLQYSGLENFHGLYSPWGHKDLDMTENFTFTFTSRLFLSYNSKVGQ